MRRALLGGIAASALFVAVGTAVTARAEDGPLKVRRTNAAPAPGATIQPAAAAYSWTGAYVGFNAGAALGTYDTSKITTPGTYLVNPANVAAVNAAGQQQINRPGFTGGMQAGYNWQLGRTLLGIEADFNYLHMGGASNSGAIKYPVPAGLGISKQFIVYSYADADWLLTFRPRVGLTADNWLFYATGGLALTYLKGQLLFADGIPDTANATQEADVKNWAAGYTVGGGVETAISDRLRLKAEYSFVEFPTAQLHETDNDIALISAKSQTFSSSMKLRMNLFRLGLNYSFGPNAGTDGMDARASLAYPTPRPWPTSAALSDWEFDVGARTWFSSGTVGAPQPLLDVTPLPSNLISRLTYENTDALSGETFARLDHRSGAFVKGFIGAGGIIRGTLVDEDFPGDGVYSNTTSPLHGNIGYANIDVGYSFLTAPGAKVGAFVGYNYYTQHLNGLDAIRSPKATSARSRSILNIKCLARMSATTCCASGYPPSSG